MTRKLAIAHRMRVRFERSFSERMESICWHSHLVFLPQHGKAIESGVNIPGEAMLAVLVIFGVDARWLLTGEGQRFLITDRRLHAART